MAEAELFANRLKAFFAGWTAARASGCGSTLSDRLTRFFEQFRSLSTLHVLPEIEVPSTLKSRLSLDTLETTVQLLRTPLIRARSAGAFLNVWSVAGLKRAKESGTPAWVVVIRNNWPWIRRIP